MRKQGVYIAIILVITALLATPVFAQPKTEIYKAHKVSANSVLVKFKQSLNDVNLDKLKLDEDLDRIDGVGGLAVKKLHSRTKNVEDLLTKLSVHPDVEYAEPDYLIEGSAVPNDVFWGQQWGMYNTGQNIIGNVGIPGADIGATQAWNLSTGSWVNVIGIVDSGIDYAHPDLSANVWSAPSAFSVSIGGVTVNCAAGTHGFNAITNSCDPMDDHYHGTHVSGIVGAVGNSLYGVVGVNWVAKMMGLKFLDSTNQGFTSGAVNAIEFAIQAKSIFGIRANVRVLNNSWLGGAFSQTLLNEISRANTNDILFVAAAGNTASNNDAVALYPANYNSPNVISVAATDNQDRLASFSNYGAAKVHLGAPGVDIISTLPNGNYGYLSGTSMATPHVSGAAALVLSRCNNLSTSSLKSALLNNVDYDATLAGKTITAGRLNVDRAISSCTATPASYPVISCGTASSFGDVLVSTTSTGQIVTISNIGTSNLIIGTTSITGTHASQFSKVTDSCSGKTVAPSGTCTVQVTFAPTSLGVKSAYLAIPSNDPFTSTLNLALTGTGVWPNLSISKSGTGTGSVTSSPASISCGATCGSTFATGSMVTLAATADPGSTFAGWSGACSGTGPCTITMNANKTVTATFNSLGPIETGATGWSPQNLPIYVEANSYHSPTGYDEQSFSISKTLNLRPGVITISGESWVGDIGQEARFGIKIDGVELPLSGNTYNSSYTGSHLVELYVYAYDNNGDIPGAYITSVSIPVN